MPDTGRFRRSGGALAAAALLGLVAAVPGAGAQTDDPTASDPATWSGSRFTEPFQGSGGTVSTESFPISGIMTKQRNPGEAIVRVDVRFGDGSDGSDEVAAPEDPEATLSEVQCVPADPAPFIGGGTVDEATASYAFTVPAEASVWPCNGRYTITASAQSNQEVAPYELVATLSVAVPPAAVTAVDAATDDASPSSVIVTWEPLDDEDLAVDAIGYRVERAGPDGDAFEAVSPVIGVDEPATYTDTVDIGGDYSYRVRALRDGPDGPVPSRAADSDVAEVTVAGDPDATTSTTARPNRPRGAGGRGGAVPPRRGSGGVAGPPTTLDTGFEGTLDYGERGGGDSPELAGREGQSIIRTDDGGVGLAAPLAGGLVLLGWAGHIAYLNRLARQF